jgi:hypothetical protein
LLFDVNVKQMCIVLTLQVSCTTADGKLMNDKSDRRQCPTMTTDLTEDGYGWWGLGHFAGKTRDETAAGTNSSMAQQT